MKKQDIFLPSADGKTTLHGIVWEPEGEVRAVLQLVHGMAEYIDRYHDFAAFLTEHGFAVIGHDHLGHGQSVTGEENRAFFAEKDGARIIVDDIRRVAAAGEERWPGRPRFILGHSMGSFLTRRYLTRYGEGLSGAVIMGTGMVPGALANTGRVLASLISGLRGGHYRSKLLVALSVGGYNKPFEPARTPVDWLSRNEENTDRYVADPLCGFSFTAGAYRDFFTVLAELAGKKDFDRMRRDLPVLITMGEYDPVGGPSAGEKLLGQYRKMGMKDVILRVYPQDRHEILNESDREQVYADILEWMEKRID